MNQTPILVKEPKPKTGNGSKAYKSLTSAVKAAEKEKEQAKAYMEQAERFATLAGNSANMTRMHLEEHEKLLAKHQRFETLWLIAAVAFCVAYTIFC